MYIEKDLEKIKKLGKKRENENIRFRSELKQINMTFEEIDSVVHKIYYKVIEEIDCTECANCCIEMKPTLLDEDIKTFVRSLEITEEEFRNKYIEESEPDGMKREYEFNNLPCPFLKDNLCTNYENRPEDCRSYPHLHKEDFTSRLWGVIENYSICPIVFNVFEELKHKIRTNRAHPNLP